MSATRTRTLAALAVVTALLGALGEWWLHSIGAQSFPLPRTVVAALVAAAVAVLVFSLPVRRWTSGDRSKVLDPLRAARTVAMAKAASHSGALFTGWFLGLGIGLVRDLAVEPRRERFIIAMAAVVGSLLLTAAGLLAERWCRWPPEEDQGPAEPDSDELEGSRF